ncbi:major facilitator superfamily domain-containing protein 6 [Nomia melanderi]|uniref:major facilitator superfamily domain-containing protein 6 n=1 Tax=Nomia melanderi TaxID=2448451 RepID=UPI00130416C1|nr:major facilitator superfamily domain-containing protein 6 [Nomia melanderi]XP_031843120.1 major facilitator superfamily domain-containing protein 6 [Nomia melanderi]XP_031843121.1 major facilitator superfamily domain-containing protein 6 [Nomia melanderi]XP_031843122.1 major facilitator superfamily domain-containing protein 6 [Nomia melanderi]XP_031843123.1 major facilitator superfamily domain-containing protein 6 [Nomia melanderi]XP_031843124.1 major facilitator superfamily domain-containi
MKLNYKQLPIKAHYFFFMAAMGPILPFFPVYGKQLGISALVMGSITAVLPILFLIAKPAFGFLVDYFDSRRKTIFVILLAGTSISFICMYFLPPLPGPVLPNHIFQNVSCASLTHCSLEDISRPGLCMEAKNTLCHWTCPDNNFSVPIQFKAVEGGASFSDNTSCLLDMESTLYCNNNTCNVTCDNFNDKDCLYTSLTFWGFVLLMSLGNIGFNVCNSISDAICFDILGEGGQMGYGRQRVWGTIGFGISAFLAGYAVDYWSEGSIIKIYTPAFLLIFIFSFIDILCCRKLKLPVMAGSGNILKDVFQLLKYKPIIIFLCFATIAGILDSFIIYFLFWYLEDLALVTGYMDKGIKLIEGLIVAAETLGSEVVFFPLSGKILKKLGFGYTFTFCFVCYSLRLGLISLAPNPWLVIPIELFMQGPTYALCYTSIVAYASKVAPPGTSATVQGIVAGMDDGFGFAIGSLIGGILYKLFGGVTTLRLFSSLAAVTALTYLILHLVYLKHTMPDTKSTVEWKSPQEAKDTCVVAGT